MKFNGETLEKTLYHLKNIPSVLNAKLAVSLNSLFAQDFPVIGSAFTTATCITTPQPHNTNELIGLRTVPLDRSLYLLAAPIRLAETAGYWWLGEKLFHSHILG